MKFRIHAKNENIIIKGKPAFGERINEREVDYLEKTNVPGFFQITYDGKKQLTYEAPACVTLEKYLKEARLEQPYFWKIMAQMLDVELVAQSRGLYPVHLVMSRDMIFIEEDTLKMYFLYQPITGAKDVTDNLFALIHDIIYEQLKKNGGTGPDYLIDFQNYLQRGDYRLEHIRQYIGQALSGNAARGMQNAPQQAQDQEPEQYTVMLGSGRSADSAPAGGRKSIQVTRLRTKERVSFAGDVVKMGRSNQNTYCIVGNSSIGRSHAAIVRRGDVCYLKDMGSVNGTSVNGRRLAQNQACRLQSGDRIQLSDEEFVFELR